MLEIEASKSPKFDLKVVSVIEMTFLYDDWYSIVLLRPKKVKLPTQSAEKWSCMGQWAFKILADFFFSKREGLRRPEFFQ